MNVRDAQQIAHEIDSAVRLAAAMSRIESHLASIARGRNVRWHLFAIVRIAMSASSDVLMLEAETNQPESPP